MLLFRTYSPIVPWLLVLPLRPRRPKVCELPSIGEVVPFDSSAFRVNFGVYKFRIGYCICIEFWRSLNTIPAAVEKLDCPAICEGQLGLTSAVAEAYTFPIRSLPSASAKNRKYSSFESAFFGRCQCASPGLPVQMSSCISDMVPIRARRPVPV